MNPHASHTPLNEPVFAASRFDDAAEHGAAIPGWDVHYVQMGCGRFEGSSREVHLSGIQLFRETSNLTMNQYGVAQPGSLIFGGVLHSLGSIVVNGTRIDPSRIGVMRGDREFDAVLPPTDMMVLAVSQQVLYEHLRVTEHVDVSAWMPGAPQPLDGSLGAPGFALRLREMLELLYQNRDAPWSAAVEAQAREHLLDSIAPVVLAHPRMPRVPVSVVGRTHIVRRAREYIQSRIDEPLRVSDLCRALRVSRRELQYSFQDTLGVAPAGYLRLLRLNGARRDLLQPLNTTSQVKDVVARWGFWHPSRFSAEYRAMFGELPSATIASARGVARG